METIKVYLDDLREVPEGWIVVKSAQEAIELLECQGPKVFPTFSEFGSKRFPT